MRALRPTPARSDGASSTCPPFAIPAFGASDLAVYTLLAPSTHSFELVYDTSVARAGASYSFSPIRPGAVVSKESAIDLASGQPLELQAVSGREAKGQAVLVDILFYVTLFVVGGAAVVFLSFLLVLPMAVRPLTVTGPQFVERTELDPADRFRTHLRSRYQLDCRLWPERRPEPVDHHRRYGRG